jgi:NAD(P)H-dependent FMN reductase
MLPDKPSILALCGSLAANSLNHNLLEWLAVQSAASLQVTIYDGLGSLPLFNPDLIVSGNIPSAVTQFKDSLRNAAGVIVCTPEYAMGPPGALKNALDWTVATSDFSGKPTLLITAASMGEKSHASLLGTLRIIEARVDEDMQVHIPFAKAKIAPEGPRDEATRDVLLAALGKLAASVAEDAPMPSS